MVLFSLDLAARGNERVSCYLYALDGSLPSSREGVTLSVPQLFAIPMVGDRRTEDGGHGQCNGNDQVNHATWSVLVVTFFFFPPCSLTQSALKIWREQEYPAFTHHSTIWYLAMTINNNNRSAVLNTLPLQTHNHSMAMPPASLVACNIYITAAASQRATLLRLLCQAQEQCHQLRLQNDGAVVVGQAAHARNKGRMLSAVGIIHAYADIPYDRSSFHIAGRSDCVSDVAASLVCSAVNDMEFDPSGYDGGESRHPFVGVVDHVSVMPLVYPKKNDSSTEDIIASMSCDAAANAAREIGRQISKTNLVNVHYYGRACPHNTPLSKVRRERTSFFGSGGSIDRKQNGQQYCDQIITNAVKGDTTIGTPVGGFVENFNIRLTSNVNLHQAKSLTQFVRGRNINTMGYGVVGVEALTLPYVRDPSSGGTVYEVACNLTNPHEGGVIQIRDQLTQWIEKETAKLSSEMNVETSKLNYDYFVEDAYCVGTTEEQCLRALLNIGESETSTPDNFWEGYDKGVFSNFEENLLQ